MIVCGLCGNKRCPHAADHDLACTASNDVGQPGSAYQHGSGAASSRRFSSWRQLIDEDDAAPTAPPASGEPVRGGWGGEAQRGLRGTESSAEGLGDGE